MKCSDKGQSAISIYKKIQNQCLEKCCLSEHIIISGSIHSLRTALTKCNLHQQKRNFTFSNILPSAALSDIFSSLIKGTNVTVFSAVSRHLVPHSNTEFRAHSHNPQLQRIDICAPNICSIFTFMISVSLSFLLFLCFSLLTKMY